MFPTFSTLWMHNPCSPNNVLSSPATLSVSRLNGLSPSSLNCTGFCGTHSQFQTNSVLLAVLGKILSTRRASKVPLQAKGKGGSKKASNVVSERKGKGDRGSGKVSEGSAYAHETRKTILCLNHVDKKAPDGKHILKGVSLGMYMGAKIGILGANGAGKSTVMRILAGKDTDFLGDLELDENIRIGHLEQEPILDGETVIENLEPALEHTKKLLRNFEEISMMMAEPDADMDALTVSMDQLQSTIDACGGWEIDKKLELAMQALGCPPRDAKIATLSGGERRRVAICRLLISNPDILLLDEPTNHLDAQSVAWLERFLGDFKGTVVAITHDRYFLDNVAGWILELDQGQGIPFEGNYSAWLDSKARRLQAESKAKQTLAVQMQQELDFINAQRAGRQKKGKARLRRYEDLEDAAKKFTRDARLDSIVIKPGPRITDTTAVKVRGLCKGYGDRLLIGDANFEIPAGAVVGIIGPNGAGKSTLFKLIMGEEKPDSGELIVGDSVVPMYVDQGRGGLNDDLTVYDELTGGVDVLSIGGREVMSRAYCSWFNFKGTKQSQLVSTLSGGERNRLQLAKTLLIGGNLLLLDEPSNDLDVDTLRALETAIENFAGTTLVVSHDRWFLDRIATHILAYEGNSRLVFFEGGWDEYEKDRIASTGIQDPTSTKYMAMPTFS